MASSQDIKRRIRADANIMKITRAMEAVSAAKLRKAQEAVTAARPYAARLAETLHRLAATGVEVEHPLLAKPAAGRSLYVVIAADRGLAGGYNANILRYTSHAFAGLDEPPLLVPVGRKVNDYFRRRNAAIPKAFLNIGEEARFSLAEAIGKTVIALFTEERVREVRLVYSEFVSALTQRPKEVRLLPVEPPEAGGRGGGTEYIFVPSAERLLEVLLPKLVDSQIYQGLLEAKASEHAARMTAMHSATDNASELIDALTLEYNRARQAAITKELSEIVSGAEALSQ